jgi:hypothetical protein
MHEGTLLHKPQSLFEHLFWEGEKHELYLTSRGWWVWPASEAGSASRAVVACARLLGLVVLAKFWPLVGVGATKGG